MVEIKTSVIYMLQQIQWKVAILAEKNVNNVWVLHQYMNLKVSLRGV